MAVANTCTECCDTAPPCDIATVNGSAGYTVVSGSWTNTTTSSANALVAFNATHPSGGDGSLAISATIQSTALGDKLRIIPKYVDANNYVAVEFEFGNSSTCGTMRVITRTAGSDTIEGNDQPIAFLENTSSYSVKVFYKVDGSDALVYVQVSGARTFGRTITHLSASNFGIGTSTLTGTAGFGIVQVGDYLTGNDCEILPNCIIQDATSTEACEWDVISGTWTFGATIQCTAAGIAVSKYENWTDDNTVAILASPAYSSTASTIGVVCDWVDSSNYHLVTYKWASFSLGVFTIIKVSGGASTTLVTKNFSQESGTLDAQWYVCIRDGNIAVRTGEQVSSGFPATLLSTQTTLHGGKRAGLYATSVSGASPMSATLFTYQLSVDCEDAQTLERNCAMCAPCWGDVTDSGVGMFSASDYAGDLPKGWKLVFSGFSNGTCGVCSTINGTFLFGPLWPTNAFNDPLGGVCQQYGVFSSAICGVTARPRIFLYSDRIEVKLQLDSGSGSVHTGKWVYNFSEAELCDITAITDAAMTGDSLGNAGCNVSSASVVITAL